MTHEARPQGHGQPETAEAAQAPGGHRRHEAAEAAQAPGGHRRHEAAEAAQALRGHRLPELAEVMRRLLAPDGCPWDRQQTLATLAPYVVEETFELVEAIEHGSVADHREELGDVLFQVVFQAALREAEGAFTLDDVIGGIAEKLIRRHPHVFGAATAADAEAVKQQWEEIKAAEKAEKARKAAQEAVRGVAPAADAEKAQKAAQAAAGAAPAAATAAAGAPAGPRQRHLDGIPAALPALQRAQKLGARAARVGFDAPDAAGYLPKVHEEVAELEAAIASGDAAAVEAELGDVLFAVVNVARKLGCDAESALRGATRRFYDRFGYIEDRLAERGDSLENASLAEMDALWAEAKRRGPG